jgi:hypothetical protein
MIDLKVSAHLRLNLDKVPIKYEVVVLLGFINIYNKFTLKF